MKIWCLMFKMSGLQNSRYCSRSKNLEMARMGMREAREMSNWTWILLCSNFIVIHCSSAYINRINITTMMVRGEEIYQRMNISWPNNNIWTTANGFCAQFLPFLIFKSNFSRSLQFLSPSFELRNGDEIRNLSDCLPRLFHSISIPRQNPHSLLLTKVQ